MPRRSRAAPIEAQPSYKAWKDEALRTLQRDHNLPPNAISEREWTRLYVNGFPPDQAADRAEREYHSTHSPDWVKRKRKR
jgi:hypothetical protein